MIIQKTKNFEAAKMWPLRGEETNQAGSSVGVCRKAQVWPDHRGVLGVWFSNIWTGIQRIQPSPGSLKIFRLVKNMLKFPLRKSYFLLPTQKKYPVSILMCREIQMGVFVLDSI